MRTDRVSIDSSHEHMGDRCWCVSVVGPHITEKLHGMFCRLMGLCVKFCSDEFHICKNPKNKLKITDNTRNQNTKRKRTNAEKYMLPDLHISGLGQYYTNDPDKGACNPFR